MRVQVNSVVTTKDIAMRLGVSRHRAWRILESLVKHGAIKKVTLRNNLYAPIGKRIRITGLPKKNPFLGLEYDIIKALDGEALSYVALAKRMGLPKEPLRGKLNYMVTKGFLTSSKTENTLKKYKASRIP